MMAKLKVIGIVAGVIGILVLATYIMNLPAFSNEISMKNVKAGELAKSDFDAGRIRFIEVYKEDTKEPANSKWEVPSVGQKIVDKYGSKIRIEKDPDLDINTFRKNESSFANSYNKTMGGFVNEREKSLIAKNPPPQKVDASQKDAPAKKDAKLEAKDNKKKDSKPVAAKPPPPPPVIIDTGDIPMDKVKAQDLAKTDIERGKIRFIEVYREDSKKPGSGKWEVYFAKEIGKELLEKYPERIKVEKKPDVDPKKFQKDEGSYASAYNKAIFKTLNPDHPMFKPPPPKPANKDKKTDTAKKPAEPAKTPQEKKPDETAKQPVQPPEKIEQPKPVDQPAQESLQQKLEQPGETPQMILENKDAQPKIEQPPQEIKVENPEIKPAEPVQPAPAEKPEELKKPEIPAEPAQPIQEKPVEPVNQ
ncbi:MAG TPA: hypothetical protein DCZ94_15365 [Lentisphaeria bacterium]|nr:MAG: hypothetical protein A2X48_17245 [Lentisphaerae bacterium GWF2_49_21]HBC88330.1 hypothetical protein [Lentisphaeria bacterium]